MLRPPGSPPMPPEYRARIEAGREQFKARVRRDYGLELNQGPFGVDSSLALILHKYAEAMGKGEPFRKAVMRAYWQDARRIDDLEVLKAAAAEAGLDPEEVPIALQNQAYIGEMDEDIAEAQEYGLSAVPALIFAEKYLVMGAQPYDTLRQVVERVQAENPEN